eukprot:2082712-Rhodomonas_salina.1
MGTSGSLEKAPTRLCGGLRQDGRSLGPNITIPKSVLGPYSTVPKSVLRPRSKISKYWVLIANN